MSGTQLRQDRVYLVSSEQDDTVRLGLNPHYKEGGMRWFDTLRPRVKQGKVLKAGPTSAEFEAVDGARYKFEVLSLAFYDQHVRDTLEGTPSFKSDDEMHKFFVDHFSMPA